MPARLLLLCLCGEAIDETSRTRRTRQLGTGGRFLARTPLPSVLSPILEHGPFYYSGLRRAERRGTYREFGNCPELPSSKSFAGGWGRMPQDVETPTHWGIASFCPSHPTKRAAADRLRGGRPKPSLAGTPAVGRRPGVRARNARSHSGRRVPTRFPRLRLRAPYGSWPRP